MLNYFFYFFFEIFWDWMLFSILFNWIGQFLVRIPKFNSSDKFFFVSFPRMTVVLGLAACALSSFCFGSMYVVCLCLSSLSLCCELPIFPLQAVRRAGEAGDGMVVQWLVCRTQLSFIRFPLPFKVCSAIFIVGLRGFLFIYFSHFFQSLTLPPVLLPSNLLP